MKYEKISNNSSRYIITCYLLIAIILNICLDSFAIDHSCIDLIYNSKEEGRDHIGERVRRQHVTYILEAAAELNIGNREYDLICID